MSAYRICAPIAICALLALTCLDPSAGAAEAAPRPPNPVCAAAIAAGRAFLVSHQQPDGSWSDATADNVAASSSLVCTAFCLHALAARPGTGDESTSEAAAMARAVSWLIAGQDENGSLSARSLDQAAATTALVAAARAKVPGSDVAARRATAVVLDRQRMLGEPPRTAWSESTTSPDVVDTEAGMWSLLALVDNPAPHGTAIDDASGWLAQTYDVANSAIVPVLPTSPDASVGAARPDATQPALFPARVAVAPNGELTVNYSEPDMPATALACYELIGAAGHEPQENALAAAAERYEFASARATPPSHDWRRRYAMAIALAAHRRDADLRLRWLARLRHSTCAERCVDGAHAGSWDGDAGCGRMAATAHALLIIETLERPWQVDFTVDGVLAFFSRCQETDGSWNEATYRRLCDADPPSAPDGKNAACAPPAYTTSLVLLCYLGLGYDHQTPNKYRPTMKSAFEFLVDLQDENGSFDADTGTHALATIAVAEAFAMTGDPDLHGVAQSAVTELLRRQRPLPGTERALGWSDGDVVGRFDTWTTTWSVMALKSALAGQLNIGDGLAGSSRWLEICWKAANPAGETSPTGGAHFPATVHVGAGGVERCEGDATEWGLTCAVFLGHHADSPLARSLARSVLVDDLPLLDKPACDLHRSYMGTLGLFQVGGDGWTQWLGAWARHGLSQPANGCATGSVDPDGFAHAGIPHGRLGSTAFAALTQSIVYRYEQVAERPSGSAPAPRRPLRRR